VIERRSLPRLPSRAWLAGVFAVCALALGSCGNTLQDEPIGPKPLETVMAQSRFPVYWAGLKFAGLPISGVSIDPSESVSIRYGDCVVGGQYTCVTPLSIVTSPDNSFLPGGGAATSVPAVRGVKVSSSRGGRTLALATGVVVVSVYAQRASLAREALRTIAPVNEVGGPLEPLPAALPDTGFGNVPLPGQVPRGVSVPRQVPRGVSVPRGPAQ
jgi:hypothetical protein